MELPVHEWERMHLTRAHLDDRLRAAEQARLVEAATMNRPEPFYAPVLAFFGQRLIKAGQYFERRYSRGSKTGKMGTSFTSRHAGVPR